MNLSIAIIDFDGTITNTSGENGKYKTSWGVYRKYLGTQFSNELETLFQKYGNSENDTNLTTIEKFEKIQTWFEKSLDLYINKNIQNAINKIIINNDLEFRKHTTEFLTKIQNIYDEVIILSAGHGNIISQAFEHIGHQNIKIIANTQIVQNGIAIKNNYPVIHSLNKAQALQSEIDLSNYNKYLIVGDSTNDVLVQSVIPKKAHVLKIGIVQSFTPHKMMHYNQYFDMVFRGDDDVLKKIINQICLTH